MYQFRPSVRLSNAGIVSKRMDISSHFFDILHGRGVILVFFRALKPLQNFKGNPQRGR